MGTAVIRRAGWAAGLATAWCAAFAAVHLFWALGGSAGLASSAGTELATRRPASFVLAGLWGVGGGLLAGAVIVYVRADRGMRPARRMRAARGMRPGRGVRAGRSADG